MSLCSSTFPSSTSHYELGVSSVSRQLVKDERQLCDYESRTILFGWRQALAQQIIEVQHDCKEDDWNGHGAIAITKETMFAALIFLDLLPNHIQAPDINAESTGRIGFLWEKGDDITFVVSVSSETIVFVELCGSSKNRGERRFLNRLPTNIEKTLLDYFCVR